MDAAKSKEFEEVKQAILKRYNINEETYRQRFRNTKKKIDESYVETEVRLKDLAAKWLKPTKRTKEGLVNVIIREQLVNAMPKELQLCVRERKPKMSEDASPLYGPWRLCEYTFLVNVSRFKPIIIRYSGYSR